jgi:putative spermidine/putrescine transport system permease protein
MIKKLLKVLFALIILLPFAVLLMLSLGRNWAYPHVFPAVWTLENWRVLLLLQSDLGRSLLQSLLISLTIAIVVTSLSFFTSKHIAFSTKKQQWLLLAYFPYVFAPVILGACLQFFFFKLNLAGNLAGVLLAQVFITYPFGIILFTGFWNERTRAMEQLVATLGGNTFQTYIKVLLPVAKSTLLVGFFQIFLISWFEYGLTNLIGVGKVQTLTIKVFQYVNEANVFYAALASFLLTIPPVLLLWLNKRFVFNKIMS